MKKQSPVQKQKRQPASLVQHQKKKRIEQKATKHICHRCKHKYLEMGMRQVSLYDGEYRIWTLDRAAYFRRHSLKYPTLVWLCSTCYREAQQAQAEEARTGEPTVVTSERTALRPRSRKARNG